MEEESWTPTGLILVDVVDGRSVRGLAPPIAPLTTETEGSEELEGSDLFLEFLSLYRTLFHHKMDRKQHINNL